jgi:TetR/AcrR family transcriptional regulator, transcriptional repressor for nem operon
MRSNTSSPSPRAPAERGRPREFDPAAVLAAAGKTFREQGYHATSIDDLCRSTGLLRGSLYSAFGDKRGILLATLDHYGEGVVARLGTALNAAPPGRDNLREALLEYIRIAASLAGLHGCLVTNSAIEMLPQDPEVSAKVQCILRRMAGLLSATVIRGQACGVFNAELDERAVGTFLMCMLQGLRVLSKISEDEHERRAIVDLALRALI